MNVADQIKAAVQSKRAAAEALFAALAQASIRGPGITRDTYGPEKTPPTELWPITRAC